MSVNWNEYEEFMQDCNESEEKGRIYRREQAIMNTLLLFANAMSYAEVFPEPSDTYQENMVIAFHSIMEEMDVSIEELKRLTEIFESGLNVKKCKNPKELLKRAMEPKEN